MPSWPATAVSGCKNAPSMPDVRVFPKPEEAHRAAAETIATLSRESITARNRFCVALSGGSTPRRLYRLLASDPFIGAIDWTRWHVFWGDERCVPPDHDDSNYRMAEEALLDHVPIPDHQIYRIRGEAEPAVVATEYEEGLRGVLPGPDYKLDLILLGMGDDGHTASLFPETKALAEKDRLVVANWVPKFHAYRITFTLALINGARTVLFLVAGESKSDALSLVLDPTAGGDVPPAASVRPASGDLRWIVDGAAASRLKTQHR